VARYRERRSVSGAKNDAADAHTLADTVRTDSHQLRTVAGDSAQTQAIKVVARAHKTLIWERTRHTLRLRHALREFFPAALVEVSEFADLMNFHVRAPRPGQIIIGDKNYFGAEFETTLAEAGLTLLRPARKGEPPRAGTRFFKPCATPSNRSSTPTKANSTSKTTAPRPPTVCWSASCNASSP
jgi:hypothetical protein